MLRLTRTGRGISASIILLLGSHHRATTVVTENKTVDYFSTYLGRHLTQRQALLINLGLGMLLCCMYLCGVCASILNL
ncbi:hypothetical protein BJ170DRAFT_501706 [Xylariales sp. AK1849]|nr:hypothetical protein BJ170DRAFT_501706 [Xylariales sp. AK1849]